MEYALITGATGGIGYEMARLYARAGYGLVLVSSSQSRLDQAKGRIQEAYNVPVYVFEQDLTAIGAAEKLYEKVEQEQLAVTVLINNAGFGLVGATDEIDLHRDEQMIAINVVNLVSLSKLFLAKMYGRDSGKILNVASTGAFQPGPYTSTYFASKAFVLSYSRAIRYEAKARGVQVSTLCPGATKTDIFSREGTKTPANAMPAEKVALIAFHGLERNKEAIIPGIKNRLLQMFPLKIKMISIAKMKQKH